MADLIHLAGMAIKTNFEYPPIPYRGWDWSAVDDQTYDGEGCPIGRGATEAEAVADLIIETQRFHDQAEREAAWRVRLAKVLEPFDDDEPTPEYDPPCERCGGTGRITVSVTYPMAYVCAGDPPDHARGVTGATCYHEDKEPS